MAFSYGLGVTWQQSCGGTNTTCFHIHDQPAEGNFRDSNDTIKTQIVADYKRHKGYVDKGDRITNSHAINHMDLDEEILPPVGPGHSE
jgi:hypothetical protein